MQGREIAMRDGTDGRLSGKVALVTGAGRGIGRSIAARFAREGAAVIVAQRSFDEARQTALEIEAAGGSASAARLDVRDAESIVRTAADVLARYGRCDILCNNAGIGHTGSVVDCSADDFESVQATNVRGPFLCMKHVVPIMLAGGSGSIINVTSILSFRAGRDSAAYCTSKGALVQLTRQAALDYAPHGVRVNALAPGYVETDQFRGWINGQDDPQAAVADLLRKIPSGRIGQPDDIAGAAVFLASDDAAWVTGSTLVVDGGTLAG